MFFLKRGIHIELVGHLSTDGFILALHRFIAQRGHVNTIQYNNGTCFVGAFKKVNNAISKLEKNKFAGKNRELLGKFD